MTVLFQNEQKLKEQSEGNPMYLGTITPENCGNYMYNAVLSMLRTNPKLTLENIMNQVSYQIQDRINKA